MSYPKTPQANVYARLRHWAGQYLNSHQLRALYGRPKGRQRLNLLVGQIAALGIPMPPIVARSYAIALSLLELPDPPPAAHLCSECGVMHTRKHAWCRDCHRRFRQRRDMRQLINDYL